MDRIQILVVDDEQGIRDIIKEYLTPEDYDLIEAVDGVDAINKFKNNHVSLVILDVMLPKLDGWKVCRVIREESSVPIIMLTARGEEYDKLFGFELGVDDYMVKPFSPKELLARIKAVLNRYAMGKKEPVKENRIVLEDLVVDMDGRGVILEGKDVPMTPKEYDLLVFLLENRDKVFNREQLLDQVWGFDFFGDIRTVDTHVKMLREKLGKYRCKLVTIWGVGYKFQGGSSCE